MLLTVVVMPEWPEEYDHLSFCVFWKTYFAHTLDAAVFTGNPPLILCLPWEKISLYIKAVVVI